MIAILDYGAGNVRSVRNALQRLDVDSVLTADPAVIQQADKVIFPGVGEAASAMRSLRASRLDQLIPQLTQPVLGICLGLQMLCRHSEEADTDGLGIFSVDVKLFPSRGKVPHMGWNNLLATSGPLFKDIPGEADLYFVHSYYAELAPETAGMVGYILPFSAALSRDNFHAVQFHPEKSQVYGIDLLRRFLEWKP